MFKINRPSRLMSKTSPQLPALTHRAAQQGEGKTGRQKEEGDVGEEEHMKEGRTRRKNKKDRERKMKEEKKE